MTKTRTGRGGAAGKKDRPKRGRPARGSGRQRKQLVIDVSLLDLAMRVTGQNQSDTVNEALSQMAENSAILEGAEQMLGAFPNHPDHNGGDYTRSGNGPR